MRIPLPNTAARKAIIDALNQYYDFYQEDNFMWALQSLASFYSLPAPKIEWFQYIDGGRTGGKTFEDGTIHLQHPEDWKRSKSRTQGRRKWVRVVLHEWAHYYLWCDAEKKAEWYERRFIKGTKE